MKMLRSQLEILVVILFALASKSSAVESFGFLVEPSDTSAIQGETVTLYCSVNQAADSFMWVRDTAVIARALEFTSTIQDPSRYSLSYDGLSYNLVIARVLADDEGSYKCVAFSSGTGVLSRQAQLSVSSPPSQDYPTITSNINGVVAVGETIEVTCEIDGGSPVPEIELIKGNEIQVVASGSVAFVWVAEATDDGEVIECRAVHPLWADDRSAFFGPIDVVVDPPQIVLAPTEAEILVDGTASFVCSATPAPRGVYRWFLNDAELETHADGWVDIDTRETASILRLRGTRDTAGIVRCQVEAANGDVTAQSTLTVIITEISTQQPTQTPSTASPSTEAPSTAPPTTAAPSTASPTTTAPSTASPTTATPSTASPTTATPSTASPSTATPSTASPTTVTLSKASSTTVTPSTASPTTPTPPTDAVRETGSTLDPVEETDRPIPGASSFNAIFVGTVSGIGTLVAIIVVAAIATACVVTIRRRRQRSDDMYSGTTKDGDVYFRSRYIGIVRSWFAPVHRDTQKTLAEAFDQPSPDQSPYNTITSRR